MTDGPKRFYKDVSLIDRDGAFAVALDGRVAKTVGRHDLVAVKPLAEALAAEWNSQDETIDLGTMPLTRLHGFVLDAGDQGKAEFAQTIVQYAGSDLLCYRADDQALAERQAELFTPFLRLAEADGLAFQVTEGLFPVDQPEELASRLSSRLTGMATEELFARKLLTEILGSAVLALYADENEDEAFAAARIDETYQAEQWGQDAEAMARERRLRTDYDDVLRYLSLSR